MPTSKLLSGSKFLGKDRYDHYLNELLTENTIGGQKLSNAQLKEGFKKRNNKINFEKFANKVISTKASVGGRKPGSGALVKSPTGAIQKYVQLQTSSGKQEVGNVDGYLKDIIGSLDNIIKTLNAGVTADIKNQEKKRKDRERSKREGVEKGLEKGFSAVKKVIDKVVAPVKSILSRIFDFFVKMILARAIVKLIDWLADPKNQGKVKSLIRFFSDNWVKLLSLYIVFGTSFGKFARGLISLVIRSTIRLGAAVAGLAARAGISKAGKVASFLGGPRGKLLGTALEVGATVVGTMALTKTLEGGEQKTQGLAGGGYVAPRIPTFSGGGFNFKGMLGGIFNFAKPPETTSGFVSGPGGPKDDKVPAMLSDGEFVMSAGAVQKYGVDTLEAMNAAGGGTNKPKVVSGTTYAAGGGYIGETNEPFSKNPIGAIKRFIDYKFGVDINKRSTWGDPSTYQTPTYSGGSKPSSTPTGSLLNDPLGAIQRITGIGGNKPSPSSNNRQPSSGGNKPSPSGSQNRPKGGGFLPGPIQEVLDKLKGPGAATYADAGSIYAKQMLGGFGGPVSERDLSKESQAELQKAIQRAKKRTGSEIRKAEQAIEKLKNAKTPQGKSDLATQKSFLKKLKAGGIRVQYTDYADEKGQMSESAKNAKNILGQFWANPRSKEEGGGYRIEDKYDFDMFKKKVKDPKTGKMGERDFTVGELWNEGFLGKGKTTQQRLQALYLLNPFKGKGDVDMVLGGNRTAAESWGLSSSKTLLGGMLGASGKPKDKNTQALEAKRPWWDKFGMFGGASGQMARDQKAKQDFAKKNPAAKLYDKPQANTGQPYKSKFARPTNAGRTPVKPPVKPKPKVTVVAGGGQGGRRGSGARPRTKTSAPAIKASHPSGTRNKQAIHGIRNK